jgi:hypothetical protein
MSSMYLAEMPKVNPPFLVLSKDKFVDKQNCKNTDKMHEVVGLVTNYMKGRRISIVAQNLSLNALCK